MFCGSEGHLNIQTSSNELQAVWTGLILKYALEISVSLLLTHAFCAFYVAADALAPAPTPAEVRLSCRL